jgi:hypothetical protein
MVFAPLHDGLDLVQRPAGLLQRLHFQQSLQVLRAVMIAAADAERRWEKTLLDVIPNGSPGDASEIRQLPDRVPDVLGHDDNIDSYCRIVNVAL